MTAAEQPLTRQDGAEPIDFGSPAFIADVHSRLADRGFQPLGRQGPTPALAERVGFLAALLAMPLAQGRSLSESERRGAQEAARCWADEGASRASVATTAQAVVAATRERLDRRGAAADVSRDVLDGLERDLGEALREAFGATSSEDGRSRRDIFRQLVEHDDPDQPEAARRMAVLADGLVLPVGLMVVRSVDPEDRRPVDAGLRQALTTVCVASLGPEAVSLRPWGIDAAAAMVQEWGSQNAAAVAGALRERLARVRFVGVLGVAGTRHQLLPVLDRVRHAVRVAPRCQRLGSFMTLDDMTYHLAGTGMRGSEQAARLHRMLSGLMTKKNAPGVADQLDTLWLACRNLAWTQLEVAMALGVTKNTVHNRLKAVRDLTGFSYREHQGDFLLALAIADLWGRHLPLPGDPFWREGGAVRGH